jgi:hypothetical protein
MIGTLQEILERTGQMLYGQATVLAPALLAALVIMLVAWGLAWLVRWCLLRVYHAARLEKFLSDSGLRPMLGRTPGALMAGTALYTAILLGGFLTAISVFDSRLAAGIVEGTVYLLPKLLAAAAIVIAGLWLARYLGRSVLVWVSNERLPAPRRWAAATRVAIGFSSVVVAAHVLNFAPQVFLAAFIIGLGGAALATSLWVGLGGLDALRRALAREPTGRKEEEPELWHHL